MTPPPYPAVILAAGQSRRMGDLDKSTCTLGGVPLVRVVLDRLSPRCGAVAINTANPAHDALGLPVLPDVMDGGLGPLAGVLTAMEWAATRGQDWVLTVATDTPFLPETLVADLTALADTTAPVLAASQGAVGGARLHPVFGLWPVALMEGLRADIETGARRIGRWADERGARRVTYAFDTVDPFFNINTPEDLARAEALYASGIPAPRLIT